MQPFEIMISESQERMAAVVEPGQRRGRRGASARAGSSPCAAIGQVTEDGRAALPLATARSSATCRPTALADAPRYPLAPERPDRLRGSSRSTRTTVRGAARSAARCCCACSPRPTSAPSAGSTSSTTSSSARARCCARAATPACVRLTPSRPRHRGGARRRRRARRARSAPRRREAVAQAALNVAVHAAPSRPRSRTASTSATRSAAGTAYMLREAITGMAEACEALGTPVVSGNVSLYNEHAGRPDPPDAGRRLRRACSSAPRPPCRRAGRRAGSRSFLLGDGRRRRYDGSEWQALGARRREPAASPTSTSPRCAGSAPCSADARARAASCARRTTPPTAASPSRWPRSALAAAAGARRRRARAARPRRRDAVRRGAAAWSSRAARPRTIGAAGKRSAHAAGVPCRADIGRAGAARRSSLRCGELALDAAAAATARAAYETALPMLMAAADVRRLRHPRARPRRRAPRLLRRSTRCSTAGRRARASPWPTAGASRRSRTWGSSRRSSTSRRCRRCSGRAAIGHARYSTTGSAHWHELPAGRAPPARAARSRSATTATSPTPTSCARSWRSRACGSASTSDTEVICALIAQHPGDARRGGGATAMARIRGAFSAVVLSEDTLLGFRDPDGIRPLVLGDLDGRPRRWPPRPPRSTSSARPSCASSQPGRAGDLRRATAYRIEQAVAAAPRRRDDVHLRAHLLRAARTRSMDGQALHAARVRHGRARSRPRRRSTPTS